MSKGYNTKLSKKELICRVNKYIGSNYILLTPIKNQRVIDKVIVKCKKHNTVNKIPLRNIWITQSKGCKQCQYEAMAETRKRTPSQVNKLISSIDNDYCLLSPDSTKIRVDEKIELLYKPLHLKLRTSINNFKGGQRIRFSYSLGERLVMNVLDKNNIKYCHQYKVVIKGKLHYFDFYVPGYNAMIEVDGRQHFKYVPKFYKNRKQFLDRIKRDKEKDSWCNNHGVKMIRIPYKKELISVDDIIQTLKRSSFIISDSVEVKNGDRSNKYVQITDYFKNHRRDETERKFHTSQYVIDKACMAVWGCSKQEYLDRIYNRSDKQIANYYLSHSREQTVNKFHTSQCRIDRCFKKYYGELKSEYLGFHPNRFHKVF